MQKNYFKYYEIRSRSFGKIYRVDWKNPYRYLALKSFSEIREILRASYNFVGVINEIYFIQYSRGRNNLHMYNDEARKLEIRNKKHVTPKVTLKLRSDLINNMQLIQKNSSKKI